MNWLLSLPGIRKGSAAIEAGTGGAIGGAWGSASALIVAEMVKIQQTPLLVVLSTGAEEFLEDLCTFGIEGEEFPEAEGESQYLLSRRFHLAREFSKRRKSVLVATAEALKAPLPDPKSVAGLEITIRVGEETSFDDLVRRAIESGYERAHSVESPGEIAVRGGIVDLFAFEMDQP
ncbi:MAG: hypothetical protein QF645_08885, partial [Planctomycetota bacterium]|nr:hypothetical protein [Planctomycetota bacterium]